MFDLEQAIKKWIIQLRKNPGYEDGDIEEIEDHIRDYIDKEKDNNLSAKDAFQEAIAAFGEIEKTSSELIKSRTANLNLPRRDILEHNYQEPNNTWSSISINISNYTKIALRVMRKNKLYSILSISGLAVGMASCFLILLWAQNQLSFDSFHLKSDDLYRITISNGERKFSSSPWALVPTLKTDFPEIVKGTRYLESEYSTKFSDQYTHENWALVDPDFFDMFSFTFIYGDRATALSEMKSVVISKRTAEKYYGKLDVIGNVINIENRTDLIITGVIENVPSYSHMQFDLLSRPENIVGERRMETWSMDCPSYILLGEKTTHSIVSKKIEDTIIKYDKRTNEQFEVGLQPLDEVYLYALNGISNPIDIVYIFIFIAFLILLIACINFMNLATARASTRFKEVGVRKVVGATRNQMLIQFFSEYIILSYFSLLVGIILMYLFLPAFNSLTGYNLVLNWNNNLFLTVGILLIATVAGILAGIYPALIQSSYKPSEALRSEGVSGSSSGLLRRVLIVFQFSSAVILIVVTSTIYNQIDFIRNKDLGFDRSQVLSIYSTRDIRKNYESIKNQLLATSGVQNVTSASSLPLQINNNNPVYWEGGGPDNYIGMNFVCVDYDYFELFKMDFKHGRSFSIEHASDSNNYILNEAALRIVGYDDPVGKMFSMWENEGNIVGVVKDFHGTSLHNEIRPIVFVLYENLAKTRLYVKVDELDISKTVSSVENIISQYTSGYPFEYTFLDEQFTLQYQGDERIGKMLNIFTLLAIFISCLGLYGLATFMAERRAKEFAIRKLLGASTGSVARLLSNEFVVLVVISNMIAWPIAYYVCYNWFETFSYHINIGFSVFIMAGLASFVIALMAVAHQALIAAYENPVHRIKNE